MVTPYCVKCNLVMNKESGEKAILVITTVYKCPKCEYMVGVVEARKPEPIAEAPTETIAGLLKKFKSEIIEEYNNREINYIKVQNLREHIKNRPNPKNDQDVTYWINQVEEMLR